MACASGFPPESAATDAAQSSSAASIDSASGEESSLSAAHTGKKLKQPNIKHKGITLFI
jgi:hypothetical protein